MKVSFTPFLKLIFLYFFLLVSSLALSQEDIDISNAYSEYTEAAREIVYLHLNKSTYIKGEDIGFAAYVLDKKDKKPSKLTTNLYVSIEDNTQKIIAQKLIKVENGVASNTFDIDSTFSSGNYTIKAYTNWMLNFNEPNYYLESIRVINSEVEQYIEEVSVDNKLDVQFLPESGHILHNVINNIGVVIKDNLGYGVSNVKGIITNKNDEELTSFETNKFGIAKFPLLADITENYTVKFNHNNKDFSYKLNQNIDKKGIILSLSRLKSKVFVSLITNNETLNLIKGKRHSLVLHNGDNFELMDVYFTDRTTVTKAIDYNNTAPGVNILTLFNQDNKPIAERMFFNYQGVNIIKSSEIKASRKNDSIAIALDFDKIKPNEFNNLSVTVLPKETKSYNKHHNILSYVLLQPYVNGTIEQGKYYFTEVDAQKQFELDNLLLTQGWSSYSWERIFNNPPSQNYTFEQGIRLKSNINVDNDNLKNFYLLHAYGESEPKFFDVDQDQKSFMIDNLFPVGNERIFLSKVKTNEELEPAQVYIQSFPNSIPKINYSRNTLNPKFEYKVYSSLNNKIQFQKLNSTQELDEVTISTKIDRKKTRLHKLGEHKFGNIKIVDDVDRASFNTLTDYLGFYGLAVDETNGGFSVNAGYSYGLRNNSSANVASVGGRPSTTSGNSSIGEDNTAIGAVSSGAMTIFLDDVQLVDTSFLNQYSLSNVDYIEINRRGIGSGARGARGVIKIYSNFGSVIKDNRLTAQQLKLPLVFSANKKFYVPKYRYYTDDFYKHYGTIDWKPNIKINEKGTANFKISKPKVPITLFIEGIANDGSFIYEEKSISLN